MVDDPDNDIRTGRAEDSDGPDNTLGTDWRWWNTGSSGKEVKVAVGFDAAESWDRTSFHDTGLHEPGHVIGIDQSDVRNIETSGGPTTPFLDQPGRDVLQTDDIAAAQALRNATPSRTSLTLTGTVGSDTLAGGDGNDTIKGDFGNDVITGGAGDDRLAGNGVYWTNWNNPQGNYWSRTYDGHGDGDTIQGGPGNDFINGNAGLDRLDGGPGNDTVFGGQNAGTWQPGTTRTNTIHLREGWDSLDGGDGDDFLNGNMGTDLIQGGNGNDLLRGGQDDDILVGGPGQDTIYGDLECDDLFGGPGNDILILGNDPDYGDGGEDYVYFYTTETGTDTVYGLSTTLIWYTSTMFSQLPQRPRDSASRSFTILLSCEGRPRTSTRLVRDTACVPGHGMCARTRHVNPPVRGARQRSKTTSGSHSAISGKAITRPRQMNSRTMNGTTPRYMSDSRISGGLIPRR